MTLDDLVGKTQYVDLPILSDKQNAAIDKMVFKTAQALHKANPATLHVPIDGLLVLFRLPILNTLEVLEARGRKDLADDLVEEFYSKGGGAEDIIAV